MAFVYRPRQLISSGADGQEDGVTHIHNRSPRSSTPSTTDDDDFEQGDNRKKPSHGHKSHGGNTYRHNNVSGGYNHFGNNYFLRDHESDERRQLLNSLRFRAMNARPNEIQEPHLKTFEWIFDEYMGYTWNSFSDWLVDPTDNFYWIQGKAGSGKSTLMKFIVNNQRTQQALNTWSSPRETLILSFHFWMSGGQRLQQTLKGLLATLILQLLLDCEDLDQVKQRGWSNKRRLSDWSSAELQSLLFKLIGNTTKSLCIVIDGLDEYDPDDSFQALLNLMLQLRSQKNLKLCVSSRREPRFVRHFSNAKQLQLEELTEADITKCIREELEAATSRVDYANISSKDLDRLVGLVASKADGVFLWVHWALKTVLNGMDQDEGLTVLLEQLASLPQGMENLYSYMWKRQANNEGTARTQASELFAYAELLPISIFEITVATDEDLCSHFQKTNRPIPMELLQKKYSGIRQRVAARCAGLLEFGHDYNSVHDDYYEWIRTFPYIWQQDTRTQLGFVHRTAKDFLYSTTEGRQIVGRSHLPQSKLVSNLMIARISARIQFPDTFPTSTEELESLLAILNRYGYPGDSVLNMVNECGEFCLAKRDESIPAFSWVSRLRNAAFSDVDHIGIDFAGAAVKWRFNQYLRFMCERRQLSPYYKGYLFSLLIPDVDDLGSFQTLVYLADNGADLLTPQCMYPPRPTRSSLVSIQSPSISFLLRVLESSFTDYDGNGPIKEQPQELARLIDLAGKQLPRVCYVTFEGVTYVLRLPSVSRRTRDREGPLLYDHFGDTKPWLRVRWESQSLLYTTRRMISDTSPHREKVMGRLLGQAALDGELMVTMCSTENDKFYENGEIPGFVPQRYDGHRIIAAFGKWNDAIGEETDRADHWRAIKQGIKRVMYKTDPVITDTAYRDGTNAMLPKQTFLVPFDPQESIGAENWIQRGTLRQAFEHLQEHGWSLEKIKEKFSPDK